MESNRRGTWWPPCDFAFACLSWVTGVVSFWRSPYIFYRNGGAVCVVYFIIAVLFFGYPLMYMEMSLGQFISGGMLSIWDCCPLFKGIGYAALVTMAFLAVYYILYGAWSLHYLLITLLSHANDFPWMTCEHSWNTPSCHDGRVVESSPGENTTFIFQETRVAPAVEYFERRFLNLYASSGIGDIGPVNWEILVALMTAWAIVFLSLLFRHYSLGKVSYITSICKFVLLIVLLGRGASLPGAGEGVKYMFYPSWDSRREFQMTAEGYASILYSISPMFGAFAMLGSFNKKNYNFYRDSIFVIVVSLLFPILCAAVIGCFMGYLSYQTNRRFDEVMNSGPGLSFIAMVDVLSQLPQPKLWLSCFFVLMFLLVWGVQMITVESIVTAVADEFLPRTTSRRTGLVMRSIMAFVLCLVFFLAGISLTTSGGVYVAVLLDFYAAVWPPIICCLFSSIAVTWIYGVVAYANDVENMLGYKPNYLILGGIMVMSPLAMVALIVWQVLYFWLQVQYGEYVFPTWTSIIGLIMPCLALIMIPVFWLIHILLVLICRREEYASRGICMRIFGPTPEWQKMKIISSQSAGSPLIPPNPQGKAGKTGLYPVLRDTST